MGHLCGCYIQATMKLSTKHGTKLDVPKIFDVFLVQRVEANGTLLVRNLDTLLLIYLRDTYFITYSYSPAYFTRMEKCKCILAIIQYYDYMNL